jgi:DNA-binding NtrC family response regulator
MSCKILLVEDEPGARRNIAVFLHRASHHVHEAETGEVALGLISRMSFNTVISDFRLPGRLNGIDVLRHQREASPETRLILITGFGSGKVLSDAKAIGADYLEKPLLLADLLSKIETTS